MGNPSQHYGTPAIQDHRISVISQTTQVHVPCQTNPSQKGWYSIDLPWRDGRLRWPRRLVTLWDGLPTCRLIQVL